MRTQLLTLAAILTASFAAHADTATFGSFVGASSPGFANGSITYSNSTGSGAVVENQYRTYAQPFAGTEWVSYTSQPAPKLTTTYTTSATGNFAADSGSIDLQTDDTVSVYLNNHFVGEAGGWTMPTMLSIAAGDYTDGVNTFTFDVSNSGGNVTGLDFLATAVSPTPEPSSFALLGTGLLGAAGVLRRRFAKA